MIFDNKQRMEATTSTSCTRRKSHTDPRSRKGRRRSNGRRASFPSSRKVRFSRYDEIVDTFHINDLKRITNTKDIWFSEQETEEMKHNCLNVIGCMESGLPLHNEQECTRGLEKQLSTSRHHRRQHIMEAVFSVLDEQELQREEGINDPELLADIYFSRSYESGLDAYLIGLEDEQAVDF